MFGGIKQHYWRFLVDLYRLKQPPEAMTEEVDSEKARLVYAHDRIEMLDFVPTDVRTVLDVGCSSGRFGQIVKVYRVGCEVWGVEPDQNRGALAAEVLDQVTTALFNREIDLPRGYFDCIIFNDVLEHMIDPWESLMFAQHLLSDSGCVVASIPNIRYLKSLINIIVRKDWAYQHTGIMDRSHLRFFTLKSIQKMFLNCGYEIIRIKGINCLGSIFSWGVRILSLNSLADSTCVQYAVVAKRAKGG